MGGEEELVIVPSSEAYIGGGESYADAYTDSIPEMAPSIEREDGSPTKRYMKDI